MQMLGVLTPDLKNHYDIAIIGCGPAGMAAAINARIRKRDFILLGSEFCSPKLSKSPLVDNWLGFPDIKGEDLRQKFLNHLQHMDIEVVPLKVTNIYAGPPFTILGSNFSFTANGVIIATGVSAQKLFPGETEYLGRGVGYCATCDGPLYKDKTVAIVSYEKEGESEANFMANVCSKVYYIPYYKQLGKLDPKIEIIESKVQEVKGNESVEGLLLKNGDELKVDGVFFLRENLPAEQLVPGLDLDQGSIAVNHRLETNIPGLYAAGDCTGQPYQLLKAAGEGSTATLNLVKYLDEIAVNE